MQKNIPTTTAPLAAHAVVPRRAPWRRQSSLVVLGLLLLPLVVFGPAALLRGVFYVHDIQHYFFPYHALPARLIAQGHLPLWNPYAFSGIPLIGDGQTALFYPPNWLFFILPGAAALNYDILLQFGIAGVGCYLFARSLGLWRLPAFIAAVAYMFSGFLTTRVVHLSILSGAAMIPFVFFCVEQALRKGALRWFAAAAAAVALQAVAGHPQVPVYTALGLGLYAVVRGAERVRATSRWRWLFLLPLRLAGIYLLGYALAAIQILPWVELATFSPRAAGASFDFVFGGSMAGSNWLLFLFPYLYGSIERGFYAARPMDIASAVKTWEHSAYVGILPLALAGVGLLGLVRLPRRRRPARRRAPARMPPPAPAAPPSRWFSLLFFVLLLGLGILMAAGAHTPFARLIYAAPVIGKLRDVERAIVLAAFALTLLAGFGMQRLAEGEPARLRPGALLMGVLIGLAPVWVILRAPQPAFQAAWLLQPQEVLNLQLTRPNACVPLLLALASTALLFWWSRQRAGAVTQALAAALVLLDVGSYAALFNPTTSPDLYRNEPEVVKFLRQDRSRYRKATFIAGNAQENRAAQELLAVSWGMVYGIEDINGFNSLQPRRYTDYLFSPEVGDVSYGTLADERLLQPESPILSALNVKYALFPAASQPRVGSTFRQVYQNDEVRVYENTQVYPRAFFVDRVRRETNQRAVLQQVTAPGFDGRHQALVESATLPDIPAAAGPAEVSITDYRPDRIVLATAVAQPRFLVLSEMDFPGWRAYVDGAETPIYRTNYLFRGIAVPAGEHSVTFVYRPASVMVGAAISVLALAAVLGLLIYERRRAGV